MNLSTSHQTVILGLDGATFDVLDPLRKMGVLPNLSRLMLEGVVGPLESTMPPVTGPAWFALAAGRSPGSSGVYDFRCRHTGGLELFKAISSTDFRGRSLWDMFSQAGRSVAVVNYPMLYPAYPINGLMISGLLAPLDDAITFPAGLRQELDRLANGYQIDIPFNDRAYHGREQELEREISDLLAKHAAVIQALLARRPWDLFVAVLSVPDILQHVFWKHWDPGHPQHDARRSPAIRRRFIGIWEQIDELVGDIVSQLSANAHLFIVSDHGFGPLTATFRVNEWLQRKGFLAWRPTRASHLNGLAKQLVTRFPKAAGVAPRWLRQLPAASFASRDVLDMVDLDRTRALMPALSDICGQIFVNRHLCGHPGSTGYEQLVDDIIRQLDLLGQEVCSSLTAKSYRATELYRGPQTESAPDILFVLNDFACRVTAQRGHSVFTADSGSPNRSGTHRRSGILIGSAAGLQPASITGATIIDIAPTVLHLAALPIPESMDGRVVGELLPTEALARHPQYESASEQEESAREWQDGLDSDEEAAVLQRLRDLGYV